MHPARSDSGSVQAVAVLVGLRLQHLDDELIDDELLGRSET